MTNARDKANIPQTNFSSTGIDDNATSTAITIDSSGNVTIANDLTVSGSLGGITITESQISDLGSYIELTDLSVTQNTASGNGTLSYNNTTGVFSYTPPDLSGYLTSFTETNDLTAAVTWANVPDANITQSSVTQHQSALSITESQISDLGSYITLSSLSVGAEGAASGNGSLAYNNTTGVFTYTPPVLSGLTGDTDDISEGSTNLYYTDARVDSHLSGGTGVTYSTGTISIGQSVGTGDNVTFNNLTVSGDLTVSGTTTTINTETINLADNTILLNSNETGTPTQDGGIEIERGTSTNKTLVWNETTDKWTVGSETFVAGTFEGNLTGNVTGNVTGDVTGNASTATALQTARTISGVSFDGTANITLDTDDIGEGSNLYFTNERVDDRVNTLLVGGTNISLTYDDTANTLTIDAAAAGGYDLSGNNIDDIGNVTVTSVADNELLAYDSTTSEWINQTKSEAGFATVASTGAYSDLSGTPTIPSTTDDISEGSNLYYTDARVQAVSINNVSEDATPELGGDLSTNGHNIQFGDSAARTDDTLSFGADADLKIYHDGTDSFIQDTGTGILHINGSASIQMNNTTDTETYAWFGINDAVRLYYAGVQKFITQTGGAEVDGTMTATTFSGSGASLTSIPNAALDNSSITINGTGVSLGGSINVGDITGVTAGTGLTGGGTSGDVTLNVSGLTVSELAAGSLTTSAEAFADNDTTLMTSAAINDRIESFGYTTNTGDIEGVTAGTGLTGGGTSGTVTLNVSGLTTSEIAGGSLQTSAEAFSDSDSVLMTAAAIDDRILSYGYTTNTGDITGVTAGNGLTGGGASGDVTLNVGAGTGVTVAADTISIGQDVATTASVTFDEITLTGDMTSNFLFKIDNTNNRVGIGTLAPNRKLDVEHNSRGYVARFRNDGDNVNRKGVIFQVGNDSGVGSNIALEFQDGDGDVQGQVTFTSGTVTYGTFTAYHPCRLPDADNDAGYPYGTLLETTSIFYTQKNGQDTERGIRYNVRKTQSANSRSVLGAYGATMNDEEEGITNQHSALVLGDGHILCNNQGGNINVGDGICSSNTPGIGQKATANPSMIIGIAQEPITFANDSETKLVPVQYGVQQFIPWGD